MKPNDTFFLDGIRTMYATISVLTEQNLYLTYLVDTVVKDFKMK